MCSWLGVGNDPRYTPKSTFRTFPFPEGLGPNVLARSYADDPRAIRIAAAAEALNDQRESWLNPAEVVVRMPEVAPGFPDRVVPIGESAANQLKRRTLTALYNQQPQWLVNAHRALDEAVLLAYGWTPDLTDEQILDRLLELNLSRAGEREGSTVRAESSGASH
jgi:hypothetical protein